MDSFHQNVNHSYYFAVVEAVVPEHSGRYALVPEEISLHLRDYFQ
jgi:hypothetical protein